MERRFATYLATFLIVLCLPAVSWAQTGEIRGQVIDSNTDGPLPGVSVVIQGRNVGAATDANGEYVIAAAPTGEYTLQASFVGYGSQQRTVQVEADEVVTVNFELVPDKVGLEEVVVTGAGGQVEKGKLGNTIGTVDASDLEDSDINNVSELLQGREPGVQGIQGSGMTGSGSQIRIRGSASLSQSNEPVVYVDGIRADNGGGFGGFVSGGGAAGVSRLDDINPNAIERIEILKGASAATLFGSEASNGVIQIFTKRGDASQEAEYNFNVEQSFMDPITRRIEDQFAFARTQEGADALGQFYDETPQPFELRSQSAMKDLMETGRATELSGSVSGGTDLIRYYAAGRFVQEDGVLHAPNGLTGNSKDENTMGQGNVNVGIFPSESTRIRVTAQYIDRDFSTYPNANNIFGTLAAASGSRATRRTEELEYGTLFASVEETMQQEFNQETQRFNGNVNLNYRPIDPLALDATFGVDFTNSFSEEIVPFGWNVDNQTAFNTEGLRAITDDRNVEFTLDLKGNLDNEFDVDYGYVQNLTSTLTVGSQGFFSRNNLTSIEGQDFPGPGFNVVSAASSFDRQEVFQEIRQIGVFFQEQVGINDYIFVTAGARLDANSAFGDDFSTVTYPKISGSFVLSDADFWPSGGSVGPVSTLRLRTSWGQSGLQPGAFDALTTFTSFNSPDGSGVAPENLGNPGLEPEISTEWEVGVNLGVLDDQFTVDATYWDRTVSEALVSRQFPPTGGFLNTQLVNVGEIKGRGVELGVNATAIQTDEMFLEFFGNTSYLWEQVKDLGGAPPIKAGGSYPRVRNFVLEGFAPGAHFGAELVSTPDGVLPVDLNGDGQPDSREELSQMLDGPNPARTSLPANDSEVLIEEAGVEDLATTLNNYKGKPWPDWSGSFGLDFGFSNFTVSTMFEYKAGNFYVNNLDGAFRRQNTAIGRNTEKAAKMTRAFITGGVDENFNPQNNGDVRVDALETWVTEMLGLSPFSGLNNIEKADFIRWRELSLTYEVPSRFASRLGAKDLSLTVSGRNLRLWTPTGYSGEDPETNEQGRGTGAGTFDENFRAGIEAWNVPLPRRLSFKLSATF